MKKQSSDCEFDWEVKFIASSDWGLDDCELLHGGLLLLEVVLQSVSDLAAGTESNLGHRVTTASDMRAERVGNGMAGVQPLAASHELKSQFQEIKRVCGLC
jgi:hypothetical protein